MMNKKQKGQGLFSTIRQEIYIKNIGVGRTKKFVPAPSCFKGVL